MTTEIAKIDPKEYGLADEQVQTIEAAFMPKITERNGLAEIYGTIIAQEITPSLCSQAGDVRKKLVKVRTGISEIHKTQKAFYLAAGRYVDAWKNKETAPVLQMEETLTEIEEHYSRIEAQKIVELQTVRAAEIAKYSGEGALIPGNMGELLPEVYENYLLGVKTAYEQRIAAEKAAAEAEVARQKAEEKRIAEEKAEAERIRKENEKLKAEAEIAERKAKAERDAADEKARKEREAADAKLKAEQAKAEAERKAAAEAHEAAMAVERKKAAEAEAERVRVQKELEAKAEAERIALMKAEADRQEREQAELAKGDIDKVADLITALRGLKTRFTFKSKKNQKMYTDVNILLDKVIKFIES